ncbi:hypothetical protein [Sphingomonas sp. LaA6.9]|uniref:hypothetical protein n=1 Tax=Sphingomonas sp. LaA6.9 TaxID=2919914 RepID=UPI001F5004F5|nr:hypothetical protein [Sphingomonas sp. LaA6.9]MCJ8158647.1 hypothetical protein [Sphingomonas sp. LaA6.9]
MGVRFEQGSTRKVIIIGPLAFKLPKGAVGRRCNLHEQGVWERNRAHESRGPRLCPVRWCAPGGWLLIMAAAAPAPLDFDIWALDDFWDYCPGDDEWPGEPKAADWGVFQGRLVMVDYSTPALT